MRAVQFQEYGGPEVLGVGQAPEVHPGPGQVRVQVRASSVNPLDWKLRAGYMAQGKPLTSPGIVGFDASGVVVQGTLVRINSSGSALSGSGANPASAVDPKPAEPLGPLLADKGG